MNNHLSLEAVLAECAVNAQTITQQHRDELDELGFTVFHNVIDPEWLAALRQRFEELMEAEGDQAGIEVHQMVGVRRLADLVNKGTVFDRLYVHPVMLAAVHHVIQRPFKIVSLNGHDPRPGHGQQKLHSDWGGDRSGPPFHQTNALWMLDDLTVENGATRVVPGSHRWPTKPHDEMDDLLATHPQEAYVTGPAGSVGFFNGQIWHGSTENHTTNKRRVVHCAYTARENPQQTDQRQYLRAETAARLSPAARYVLDV